jgi:hypothetical protein
MPAEKKPILSAPNDESLDKFARQKNNQFIAQNEN